ncbi:MAG: tetratricopeptide repeat protein [Candidatus Electronema sp. VV]
MRLAELCARLLRFFGGDSQAAACAAAGAAATQTEAEGDWLRAAELLGQLQAANPDPARLLRLARCAARAGLWQQAADAYAEADSSAPRDLYQAGFSLAKLGDLTGCLRIWQQLDSEQPDFIAQKEQVSLLLLKELHRRLDADPLGQEEKVRALAEEFSLSDRPVGDALLARCRSLRLARLWQEERLEEITAMADQTDWLQPAALAIQAKAACQLMAAEKPVPAAQAQQFVDLWLTLLFYPEVGPQPEPLRQALLDFGLERLRRQAARQPDSGAALLRQWEETLSLLLRLHGLCTGLVYAPSLALRAGLAEQHFALIQNSREAFADDAQWIAAGAAYSAAAKALLLIREGEHEAALDALADVEEGDDPFAAWGAAQVRTACGLRCLRDRQCREAEQILTESPAHWTAELEQQLLTMLEQDDELDSGRLTACLGILSLLPDNSPAGGAFCAALTNQAVRLRGAEASPRLLAAVTAKAVALQPGDEFAQLIHDQARLSLALAQIDEAFACDCFAEAARIAAASRFPQTLEHFFETARQAAAKIKRGDCPDQEAAVFMLEELLRSTCAVDETHGAVRRIRQVLDSLRAAA